jgi:very-short-patch-repair endonuclease
VSYWKAFGIPEPVSEFKFWPQRRFRFDYAWPKEKIAVEIEGGIWTQGRHSRGPGMMSDMEKYNMAAKMGWRVFRFTPKELANAKVHEFMKGVFSVF